MSVFFMDTSALAKRYLIEGGSAWMEDLLNPTNQHTVIICDLTPVEIFSVIARRQREGTLTADSVLTLRAGFLGHLQNEYLSIPLERTALVKAREIVTQYILRSLDAVQLACALQAAQLIEQPITFLSADRNLLQAASAEGFLTDDPNSHP